MTTEVVAALIGALAGFVPSIGLYLISRRKAPAEIAGINAEANFDNATASKSQAEAASVWIDNYERVFALATKRDADMLDMKLHHDLEMGEMKQRLAQVEQLLKEREQELDVERQKRIAAEAERDKLQKQVDALTQTVEELRREVTNLTKAKQPLIN